MWSISSGVQKVMAKAADIHNTRCRKKIKLISREGNGWGGGGGGRTNSTHTKMFLKTSRAEMIHHDFDFVLLALAFIWISVFSVRFVSIFSHTSARRYLMHSSIYDLWPMTLKSNVSSSCHKEYVYQFWQFLLDRFCLYRVYTIFQQYLACDLDL